MASPTTITNTTSTQRLDPASQAYVDAMRAQASGASGMVSGMGPLTAGADPNQLAAIQGMQGPWNVQTDLNPYMNMGGSAMDMQQLMSQFGGGMGGASANLGFSTSAMDPNRAMAFMNPYEQQVIAGMQADADRQGQAALSRGAAEATAAGAFGGSRSAFLQAQSLRDVNQDAAMRMAQARMSGYSQAQNLASNEWQLRQQLGMQGAIAQMQGGLQAADINQRGQLGLMSGALDLNRMNQQSGLGYAQIASNEALQSAQLQQSGLRSLFDMGGTMRGYEQERLMEPIMRAQLQQNFLTQGGGPYQTITDTRTTAQEQKQKKPWWQQALGFGLMAGGAFLGGPAGAGLGAKIGGAMTAGGGILNR